MSHEMVRHAPDAATTTETAFKYFEAAKVALLDQQCGGRALLGLGRGLSRREYEGFGIPMEEARGRFDQGAALVLEALNKGFFEADTEYFTRPRRELRPRPTRGFPSLGVQYAI